MVRAAERENRKGMIRKGNGPDVRPPAGFFRGRPMGGVFPPAQIWVRTAALGRIFNFCGGQKLKKHLKIESTNAFLCYNEYIRMKNMEIRPKMLILAKIIAEFLRKRGKLCVIF
jgi:hypothetical protein